jgi:ABC-type multidrug transport system fused ATPase/permease subunit
MSMPQSTPFSGLSTIIHLAIIILASLILWFRKRILNKIFGITPGLDVSRAIVPVSNGLRERSKRIASIAIILLMTTTIVISFSLALYTGLKAGQNESHIQFFRNKIEKLMRLAPNVANLGNVAYERDSEMNKQGEDYYKLKVLVQN